MADHQTRVIDADRRGDKVKAVCTACSWRGRPRDDFDRASKDGQHHQEREDA